MGSSSRALSLRASSCRARACLCRYALKWLLNNCPEGGAWTGTGASASASKVQNHSREDLPNRRSQSGAWMTSCLSRRRGVRTRMRKRTGGSPGRRISSGSKRRAKRATCTMAASTTAVRRRGSSRAQPMAVSRGSTLSVRPLPTVSRVRTMASSRLPAASRRLRGWVSRISPASGIPSPSSTKVWASTARGARSLSRPCWGASPAKMDRTRSVSRWRAARSMPNNRQRRRSPQGRRAGESLRRQRVPRQSRVRGVVGGASSMRRLLGRLLPEKEASPGRKDRDEGPEAAWSIAFPKQARKGLSVIAGTYAKGRRDSGRCGRRTGRGRVFSGMGGAGEKAAAGKALPYGPDMRKAGPSENGKRRESRGRALLPRRVMTLFAAVSPRLRRASPDPRGSGTSRCPDRG